MDEVLSGLPGGFAVRVNADGCAVDDLSFCGAVTVTVPSGMRWADFVALAVEQGWVGVEALAAVSGTVGEAVARGAGAYGQRVADTVASVRAWDHATDRQRTFAMADCEFADSSSRFSRELGLEILDVAFLMRQGDLTTPVRDPELASLLGVALGGRAPLSTVVQCVTSMSV